MRYLNKLWEHYRFRIVVFSFISSTILLGVIVAFIEANNSQSSIKSISDGVWWSITTVTTVGYGDTVPITTAGRIIGVILMIAGVMLTGVILGFVTVTLFHSREDYYWKRVSERLDRIEDQLKQLEKRQNFVVKSVNNDEAKEDNS